MCEEQLQGTPNDRTDNKKQQRKPRSRCYSCNQVLNKLPLYEYNLHSLCAVGDIKCHA